MVCAVIGHHPARRFRPPPAASFQSTAHPKAGRNSIVTIRYGWSVGFNPRPTRRQAETAGRDRMYCSRRFQSTAHPKVGRNAQAIYLLTIRQFQSTAHPKVGRNLPAPRVDAGLLVSIHGPPEGRPKYHE